MKNMEHISSSSIYFSSLPFLDISILQLLMAQSEEQEQDTVPGTSHQSLSRGRTPAGPGQDGRGWMLVTYQEISHIRKRTKDSGSQVSHCWKRELNIQKMRKLE